MAQNPRQFRRRRLSGINCIEKRPVRYIAKPEKLVHIEPTEAAKMAPDLFDGAGGASMPEAP